jgi:hypothetical protein
VSIILYPERIIEIRQKPVKFLVVVLNPAYIYVPITVKVVVLNPAYIYVPITVKVVVLIPAYI